MHSLLTSDNKHSNIRHSFSFQSELIFVRHGGSSGIFWAKPEEETLVHQVDIICAGYTEDSSGPRGMYALLWMLNSPLWTSILDLAIGAQPLKWGVWNFAVTCLEGLMTSGLTVRCILSALWPPEVTRSDIGSHLDWSCHLQWSCPNPGVSCYLQCNSDSACYFQDSTADFLCKHYTTNWLNWLWIDSRTLSYLRKNSVPLWRDCRRTMIAAALQF